MEEQQNNQAQPEPAQDELAKAKAQCDEYLAGWKRAMADYANLKKESERAQGEFAKYAAAGFVSKFLPVLDSFTKAVEQRPAIEDGKPVDGAAVRKWMEGVAAIKSQFDSAMKAAGVAPIDEAGIPFDPNLHEAMMAEKSGHGITAGSVIKILEPGYKMHDRVLRAAKVIVAE